MSRAGVGDVEINVGGDDDFDDLTIATAANNPMVTPNKPTKMSMLDQTLLSRNEEAKEDANTRENFLFHTNSYKKKKS